MAMNNNNGVNSNYPGSYWPLIYKPVSPAATYELRTCVAANDVFGI